MDRRNRKTLILIISLITVSVIGIVGGRYAHNEYYTYHRSEVKNYDAATIEKAPYEIRTSKKELLGKSYVGFSVYDSATEKQLFQCPDLFLVEELEGIQWEEETYHILVKCRGKDAKVYEYEKGWRQ